MSLAKKFSCGHFRFLPTQYRKCPICNPGKRPSKLKARQEARLDWTTAIQSAEQMPKAIRLDVDMRPRKGGLKR